MYNTLFVIALGFIYKNNVLTDKDLERTIKDGYLKEMIFDKNNNLFLKKRTISYLNSLQFTYTILFLWIFQILFLNSINT